MQPTTQRPRQDGEMKLGPLQVNPQVRHGLRLRRCSRRSAFLALWLQQSPGCLGETTTEMSPLAKQLPLDLVWARARLFNLVHTRLP
jgi:hypothetical protein